MVKCFELRNKVNKMVDKVFDADKLIKLIQAAKCDTWWKDSEKRGYGITFSRLLGCLEETGTDRESLESWKLENIDFILQKLGKLLDEEI